MSLDIFFYNVGVFQLKFSLQKLWFSIINSISRHPHFTHNRILLSPFPKCTHVITTFIQMHIRCQCHHRTHFANQIHAARLVVNICIFRYININILTYWIPFAMRVVWKCEYGFYTLLLLMWPQGYNESVVHF